jgi:antitoxin ParD1/3/4
MPTRNVFLTDRQDSLIEALVQSGRYQNASEVMREGLRLVEDREVEEIRKIEVLRASVQRGEDAVARGDYKDFAEPQAVIEYLDKIAARSPRSSKPK